jgi:quercetin dioxygenase-like cupin family protein
VTTVSFNYEPPANKITNRPYKSSGENQVIMNVFEKQMVDSKMVFHATGQQTGLNLLVTEITWPPHNRTLPHLHALEDESFFVLDGSLTVTMGPPDGEREEIHLEKGEFIWAPRHHWHEVNVGPDGAHILLIQTPGSNLSQYFALVGTEVGDLKGEGEFDRFNDYSWENYGIRFWAPERAEA